MFYVKKNPNPRQMATEVRVSILQDKWLNLFFGDDVYIMREDFDGVIMEKIKEDSDSVEIVDVTELKTSIGSRYGGPATLCELTFQIDNNEHKAYFGRVTETAYNAGDFFTAMTMPLPSSLLYYEEEND